MYVCNCMVELVRSQSDGARNAPLNGPQVPARNALKRAETPCRRFDQSVLVFLRQRTFQAVSSRFKLVPKNV